MVACCCRRVWHDQETRVKGIRRKIPDVRGYPRLCVLCLGCVSVVWALRGAR